MARRLKFCGEDRPGVNRLLFAGLLAVLVSCGQGQDEPSVPDPPRRDAFAALEARPTPAPRSKAAPRWEELTVLTGSGPETRALSISEDAIQWRAEWSCQAGDLRLETNPVPRNGKPIVQSGCPGSGVAFSVKTGPVRLSVVSEGEWRIAISQQVTSPKKEAPLAEMTAPAASLLGKGDFFAIERDGKGRALLYKLADGGLALRLEDFETSANTDLFVWASEALKPATSREVLESPHVVVSELKSTIGNQNYRLPAGLDPAKVRSVVIWCRPVQIAYVAAALDKAPV